MGQYKIMYTTDDGYAFSLTAENHEIIATSQVYRSMDSLKNGIESVQKNADAPIEDQTVKDFEPVTCPKWEVFTDKADEFRFRLKASNGEIILAASQGYTKKHNALKGIESVRNNINSEIVKPVRD
ncbi:hypothetical protein AUP07_0989 [methanogenic archaeon mixed culture ISO4-G1]|nr:hypothetical protein AUP07_0989 [methanogenic archaeon mixed culture ISO4-G1]